MTTLPIVLSSGYIPLIKKDDVVCAGQIVAQKITYKEFIANVVKQLEISPEKARKCLCKKPGDKVELGDVLAVKKGFLGLSEEKILSKVSGIFSRYERDSGNIYIKVETEKYVSDIVSPVDGIVAMCDNNKIVIATDKDVYVGINGVGESAQGEVFVIEDAFSHEGKSAEESEISIYYALDSEAIGKIVVGNIFSKDLIIKCIGMGAVGIIGTKIRDEDLKYISFRHLQVPILVVDNDTIEKVIKWKSKKIYLNSQEKIILFLHS